LTPQAAKQLGIEGEVTGLVVTDIDPDGPAAEAGIARGDVILEINRQAVSSADQVQAALERSGQRPVLLLINRKGQTIYLTVRP
jgi:serine protease Do